MLVLLHASLIAFWFCAQHRCFCLCAADNKASATAAATAGAASATNATAAAAGVNFQKKIETIAVEEMFALAHSDEFGQSASLLCCRFATMSLFCLFLTFFWMFV